MNEQQRERLGELADKADNFLEYASTTGFGAFEKLATEMRFDALGHGLTEIRDDLRALYIELGGDPQTWVDPTAAGQGI